MRKGEKKLIEEYRKIEEKPENLEKLKNFLISFAKKRMDDYVINTSRRIIKLDPKSINYIIIFLSKYTLNYTIRQNYSHARWFLKKWNKLEIKGSTHRLLYKKIHYLTSKSISWYYFKVQGYLLLTKRKYNDAIKSLYKCSRLMDNEPSTHYQLASTYELIGKSEDALKEFNRCAGLAPLDPSSHYRIAYLLLEQKEYEKAFLEFQKTVEIYYEAKKNNSKRAFELAYIILDGNVGLIGETLYEIMIEAKILVHHCKGFSYLAKGNFTDAKGSFIQQNELIKKYKYSKFNFLLVLANLVEIDKKFFLLKDCSDFEHLIKEIIAISKELQPIERNSEVIRSPLHSLFQVKLYLILFFLGALLPRFKKDFQKDEPKDDKIDSEKIFNLEYATGFFEYKNLTKFQQLINCLKNFALELKQYQNPLLEVPRKNQRQLIVSLSPSFNIIDGQLTTEAMPEVQKQMVREQIEFKERLLKIEDSLSELPKKMAKVFKKEEIKEPKFKPQEAKKEKIKYEIWMPIENNEGCECEKVNQSVVEERFEELRKGHKLFIDNRYRYIYINGKKVDMVTIARRNKKTKKIKYEEVKISFIKYNLLIWFLQNKDKLFNHERLYKIGWSNPDKSTEEVDLGVSYKESLKNQISILNAIFKALGLSKKLKIESERPLGYYCEGNCDFRILKKINPENTSL